MDFKKLISSVIGTTLTLTVIFFFIVFFLLNTDNSVTSPLKEALTLTIYFFSGISTLGSVLAVIYTLYIQALRNRPNFLLTPTKLEISYDKFVRKNSSLYGIEIMNIGEPAYVMKMKLEHRGMRKKETTFGFSNSQHRFDIFKNISESGKGHHFYINIYTSPADERFNEIKNLKLHLIIEYRDKNQDAIKDTYLIEPVVKHNSFDFIKLLKINSSVE